MKFGGKGVRQFLDTRYRYSWAIDFIARLVSSFDKNYRQSKPYIYHNT